LDVFFSSYYWNSTQSEFVPVWNNYFYKGSEQGEHNGYVWAYTPVQLEKTGEWETVIIDMCDTLQRLFTYLSHFGIDSLTIRGAQIFVEKHWHSYRSKD
jgi:hypothetical protein